MHYRFHERLCGSGSSPPNELPCKEHKMLKGYFPYLFILREYNFFHFFNFCKAEHQPLDVDADIVFLVETSSFVTQNNFVKEKQFVKSLAKFMNVSSESSRASVVLYGSSPNTEIRFGDYRTLNEFNARVDRARLSGG